MLIIMKKRFIVILTVSNIYAKTNIKYYYSSDFRKKVNKMQTITFDEPESFDNYDVKEIQETSLDHFNGKLFNEIIWKFKFYMNIFESFESITFKMNYNGNDKICITNWVFCSCNKDGM